MTDLDKAIIIAVEAHQGQKDKAGKPYVFHPLRLMLKQDTPEAMITAVLHDVVEDTEFTLDQVAEAGFSAAVVNALRLLTHNRETLYLDYIELVASDPIARQVKLADLIDNMDLERIPDPQEKDFARLEKYKIAYNYLINAGKIST